MRDAIGGVFTIQIILVFMIIINAYLAFSVNYTKAFRIKNNIVAILEQQEGFTTNGTSSAAGQIEKIMTDTGYNVDKGVIDRCGSKNDGYVAVYNNAGGYCLKLNMTSDGTGGYYSVKTYISIDIPILNNIFPIFSDVFAIKGETKTIYSSKLGSLES